MYTPDPEPTQPARPFLSVTAIGIHVLFFLVLLCLIAKNHRGGSFSQLETTLWVTLCVPSPLTLPLALLARRRKEKPEVFPIAAIRISGIAAVGLTLSLIVFFLIYGASLI